MPDRTAAGTLARLWPVALALAAAVGCGLLFSGPHDVAFWSDSVSYFSAADALRHGLFIDYEGFALTLFPPVYPLLVAGVSSAGFGRQATAFAINTLAIAVIGMVVWNVVRRHGAPFLAAMALIAASLSVGPVPMRLQFAASELPFMALALVCLDQVDRRRWERGRRHALGLGFLCSLAFLTRYSGLVVAAVAGIAVLVDCRPRARDRRSTPLWFLAGLLPPAAAWLIRNRVVDGTWMGPRANASSSGAETLTGTASTLAGWVMPGVVWANTPLEWLIICGGALAAIVAAVVSTARGDARAARTVILYGAFAVVYVLFIALSSLITALDVINDRLLAPAYVPALLSAGVALLGLMHARHVSQRQRALASAFALAAVVALAMAQAVRRTSPEIDYTTARWRESPTTAAARQIGPDELCFSNVPEPVYLWTGHRCARALMELYRTVDRPPDRLLTKLQSPDTGHRIYYLWYRESHQGDRMIGDPRTLLAPYTERSGATGDGEIFELRAAH
jgi:hypothetical protein